MQPFETAGPSSGPSSDGTASTGREGRVTRRHAPEFKITVASKLDNLAKIGNFVQETGRRLNLPEEFVFDVQVATEEACTNIIQHAYRMRQDRPVVLGCRLRNNELIVRIRDFGQPFAPETIPKPKFEKKLQNRRVGGLGVFFMKKLMNRIRFKFDEARGNELTMVKRVPTASGGTPESEASNPE